MKAVGVNQMTSVSLEVKCTKYDGKLDVGYG